LRQRNADTRRVGRPVNGMQRPSAKADQYRTADNGGSCDRIAASGKDLGHSLILFR
jgi:hypothetical protein